MTPEMWQRLEPLYRAALQTPEEERSRFVADACGSDNDLRQHLIELLRDSEGETSLETQTTGAVPGEFIPKKAGALATGQLLLGRFRIIRLLGSGGMGDVYEATDLELGRIALKTIRADIAHNPEILARFKKEVQYARLVTGPQVCRIHELFLIPGDVVPGTGPAQGTAFLTMEFLEGMTLSEKIKQSGSIPWQEAKTIAIGICAGLETIHEAGIIHRDLKSRNIMMAVRSGAASPVLMDFGLAHEVKPAADADDSPELTRPGVVVGTRDYMAPEQFQGELVTPATDVYALGVVLYEMLTGRQPFPAATPFEAAVLRGHQPATPSSISRQLPRRADRIVCKCLEYKPECRYQSATEVAAALQGGVPAALRNHWRKAAAGAFAALLLLAAILLIPAARERLQGILLSSSEKHIAVLPIDLAVEDAQTRALGDGLMDSLSGELSNLKSANQTLWVIPASEVRRQKITDAAGALRYLGATIVVKGSVERHDQAVHLSLTLIDTKKMRQIGFTELDSPTGDLVGMESDAVERLGRLMNLSGNNEERDATSPSNHAAYEDYLTGLGYMERYDKPGNLDLAIASLKRSVATDDQFALALAQIGEAYRLKYELDKDLRWLQQAESYASKAEEIDSHMPAAFITLANIHEATGKHDLAVQEFQQALVLDPQNTNALSGLANAYGDAGRIEEAVSIYKRAIALRPDYWDTYDALGNFYDNHGKSLLAIDQYQHAIALTPDNEQVYVNLGGAYVDLGDPKHYPDAERSFQKAIELVPDYYLAYSDLAYLYIIEHRYAESAAASERALQIKGNDYRVWQNALLDYEWLHQDSKASFARQSMLPLALAAVKANPQDADAQVTLAGLYAHNKQADKAEERIQTALALAPDDPINLSAIADVYEFLGDRSQAVKYLNQAFLRGYTRAQFQGDPEIQALASDKDVHLPPE